MVCSDKNLKKKKLHSFSFCLKRAKWDWLPDDYWPSGNFSIPTIIKKLFNRTIYFSLVLILLIITTITLLAWNKLILMTYELKLCFLCSQRFLKRLRNYFEVTDQNPYCLTCPVVKIKFFKTQIRQTLRTRKLMWHTVIAKDVDFSFTICAILISP